MVITVAGHEELVAHPSESGPMPFVYFWRKHPELVEDAAREARIGVVREEILVRYRSHVPSESSSLVRCAIHM
jgi:hypothetical protein